jgi:hypothetical protein
MYDFIEYYIISNAITEKIGLASNCIGEMPDKV